MKILRRINQLTVLLATYVAALIAYSIPFGWAAPAVLLAAMFCRKAQRYSAYGTARWADISDVGHMLEGPGLIVGHIAGRPSRMAGLKALYSRSRTAHQAVERFLQSCQGKFSRHRPESLVRLNDAVHVSCFAPTGAGKGTSLIVPFLLTCPESCVVIDIKGGENAKLTAEARRKMGHRVVLLDPFGEVTQTSCTLNVLQDIDPDSDLAFDECNALAKAMVIRTGEERDPHWPDMAEKWIGGLIAAVVSYAGDDKKNLQTVRTLLTNPAKRDSTIEMMCASNKWGGMLARRGHELSSSKNKELDSTLTTLGRFMTFLDTIPVANNTLASSFQAAALRDGKMTIYLILPPKYISTHAALIKLWLGFLLQTIMKGGLQEQNKVHFICDEAKTLGKMDQLSDMLTIGRGYGVRLQLYYQDCGALKGCWPNGSDQTLMANSTKVFFKVNDKETAEMVSALLGEQTIMIEEDSDSDSNSIQSSPQGGGSNSRSTSRSRSRKQLGRKLLKPEEVIALSPRTAITFTPGVPPIATTLVRYYEKSFGKERAMGPIRAAFETICLFLAVAGVAVLLTWDFYSHGR